ncbi:MAG: hypothetical protein J5532_09045 [Lachnospiraceae bacterium]|nr:hypothetical protein [Lachnospiraceae bacterium]
MVNNEKVRLMTRLAIYEQKEGVDDMAVANYFRSDYTRHEIMKTLIWVTFGSIIVLAMVIAYKLDFIIKNALELNYKLLGRWILFGYLAILVVSIAVTWLGYQIRYFRSHKRLNRYYRMLGKVRKIEEQEERATDLEEEWGE